MTWIVGTATPFGYAVGLSDVCVTFGDGTELDCLQKIYPVGRYIACGFAGSVAIGFGMIQRLSQLLHNADQELGWIPSEVAKWWQEDAREVFSGFHELEKENGAQIILLCVHPSDNMGDAPWPRSQVYTFTYPNFEPEGANPNELVSIGCGDSVIQYRELLDLLPVDESLLQLEAGRFGGMSRGFMMAITDKIQEVPISGISSHLHICLVSRGQIAIGKNDRKYVNRTDLRDFVMPPVATTWEELEQIALARGSTAKGARC
jgi:hypothetical protein